MRICYGCGVLLEDETEDMCPVCEYLENAIDEDWVEATR